jgi:hypothetical protein
MLEQPSVNVSSAAPSRRPAPGQQPDDRVDHHHRRQLAAAQDVIADRQFDRLQAFDDPLVEAFVSPAISSSRSAGEVSAIA